MKDLLLFALIQPLLCMQLTRLSRPFAFKQRRMFSGLTSLHRPEAFKVDLIHAQLLLFPLLSTKGDSSYFTVTELESNLPVHMIEYSKDQKDIIKTHHMNVMTLPEALASTKPYAFKDWITLSSRAIINSPLTEFSQGIIRVYALKLFSQFRELPMEVKSNLASYIQANEKFIILSHNMDIHEHFMMLLREAGNDPEDINRFLDSFDTNFLVDQTNFSREKASQMMKRAFGESSLEAPRVQMFFQLWSEASALVKQNQFKSGDDIMIAILKKYNGLVQTVADGETRKHLYAIVREFQFVIHDYYKLKFYLHCP